MKKNYKILKAFIILYILSTVNCLADYNWKKIGDQKTSRDEMLKNLIKVLESQGFKIKNKK